MSAKMNKKSAVAAKATRVLSKDQMKRSKGGNLAQYCCTGSHIKVATLSL